MGAKRTAWLLSLSGFIPFGGLLIMAWMLQEESAREVAVFGLEAYAAVILSFLGGIR